MKKFEQFIKENVYLTNDSTGLKRSWRAEKMEGPLAFLYKMKVFE